MDQTSVSDPWGPVPNNGMQRAALRAAADAKRWTDKMFLRSLRTALIALAGCSAVASGLRITGTFSDIRADQRGVFGAEVRIAVTHDPPYQAIVQFGNGEFCDAADLGDEPCFRVSRLIVVEAVFDWQRNADGTTHVEFKLPSGSPYSGTFQGDISTDELVGVFQFDSGKRLPVKLRRGPSRWDK